MSDRIIVILHDKADEAYATAVAAALAPARAVCAELYKAEFQFGAGSACVGIWSPAAAAAGGELVLPKDAILLCVSDAPTPLFNARRLQGAGEAAADAKLVAAAVAELERDADRPGQGKIYRAAIANGASTGVAPPRRTGRTPLIGRSAIGLVATVSVVAIASHYLGMRSSATAAAPVDPDMSASAAGEADVPAMSPDAPDDAEFATSTPVEESPLFELTRLNSVVPARAEARAVARTSSPLPATERALIESAAAFAAETPEAALVSAIVVDGVEIDPADVATDQGEQEAPSAPASTHDTNVKQSHSSEAASALPQSRVAKGAASPRRSGQMSTAPINSKD